MKSKRVYDNYHCCCFCGKPSCNIIKHMRIHKEESEVAYMLNLEMIKLKKRKLNFRKCEKYYVRGEIMHTT